MFGEEKNNGSIIYGSLEKATGGILLIDYGYLNSNNSNTLQAVMGNKKISMENIFSNYGIEIVVGMIITVLATLLLQILYFGYIKKK